MKRQGSVRLAAMALAGSICASSTVQARFLQPDPIGDADGSNLYAYVGNDPLNQTDPMGLWGFGLLVAGSGETGTGGLGAGATGAVGGGIFGGGAGGVTAGGFASGGAFAGLANGSLGIPAAPVGTMTSAAGAYGGGGVGAFATNATDVGQLAGTFNTFTINTPIASIQVGVSNGTWIGSFTCGFPPCGIGGVGSVSTFPTTTAVTPSVTLYGATANAEPEFGYSTLPAK